MSDRTAAPSRAAGSWRVLLTPRWLSWHLFAVVAFVGMLWLGDWQFRRAIDGNGLSWAYTFEWPVFAVFGAVFWVKTVRDELHPSPHPAEAADDKLAAAAGSGELSGESLAERQLARAGSRPVAADDELTEAQATELAEYNAYLASLGKKHSIR